MSPQRREVRRSRRVAAWARGLGGLAAAGLLSCAGVKLPGGVQIEKPKVLSDADKLQEKRKKCDELRNKQVPFEEERSLGGAVALAWIDKGGGLAVDAPKEAEVRALKDDLDQARPITLPATKQNQLSRYLNQVGKNLAALSARPTLQWTFGVLNGGGFNAYSAPGGYVLVTRGLLDKVETEAELAGVLAHEIAHVTERHALKVYNRVKANQCGAAIAGDLVGKTDLAASFSGTVLESATGFLDLDDLSGQAISQLVDGVIDDLTTAGFAQTDELTADRIAAELLIAAGYSPKEYIRFLGKLPKGGGAFAHHPDNTERQAALQRWLQGSKPAPDQFGSGDWPYDDYKTIPNRALLR